MLATHFVAALLLVPIVAHADIVSIPSPAVRRAREWLDSRRATDPALNGALLGNGYVTISMSPKRTLDFFRLESAVDPTEFSDTLSRQVQFPIHKADRLIGSMQLFWVRESSRYEVLGQVELSPEPIDGVVGTLDRLVANGSHRVWVFDEPWPIACKAVIAEQPDGVRVAFVLDYLPAERLDDAALLGIGEPISVWAARFRTRLRDAYGLGRRVTPASHKVPAEALMEAQRRQADGSVEAQLREFGVSGPTTLGSPVIHYQINRVEQLLYSESDEPDPTVFDADPTYKFPVIAEGQVVAILHIKRVPHGCGRNARSDSIGPFRLTSVGLTQPGSPFHRSPDDLACLGDVAVLDVIDINRWYHVIGPDSAWVAPYYPVDRGQAAQSASSPRPVSSIAKSLKERILAQYTE